MNDDITDNIQEADDDGPTILPKDAWAIVWSPSTEVAHLYMPKCQPDEVIPDTALSLTALFIRWQSDDGFRDECVKWFEERTSERDSQEEKS